MATESPIRISETGRKWSSPKGPASDFASTSGNMAAEDFGLLLNSQGYGGNRMDGIPNRSGSAPPSMEGSFLGIERLLVQHNSGANAGFATLNTANQNSEEQLRADPAYLAYYCSNINLNPRLPPPLISSANCPPHHVGSFEKDVVLSSRDQSGKGLLSQGTLSTHKEELEDDHALEQPCSIQVNEKDDIWPSQAITTQAGEEKRAVDLIQDESAHSDSTLHNKSHSINPAVMEEAVDQDAGSSSTHEMYTVTSNITKSGPVDNMRLSSNPESFDAPILSSSSLDCTGQSTIEHEMKNLSISNMSKLGNRKCGETGQSVYESNVMQNQATPQDNNLSDIHGAKSQFVHQGVHSAHFGIDHFPHNSSKFVTGVQPVLHSSSFTPPLYATAAAYVNPANPFYTNVQAPGPDLYASQYLGGYAFNPPSVPPFIAAYPPHGAVPVVVDGVMSSNFSGQAPGFSAGGSISRGADMIHVNKFYGQYGFPMQPSFGDPMYMQYNQQPYGDFYGISGQFDQVASRPTAKGHVVSYDSWKAPDSAAYLDSNKFQQQKSASQTNANSRRSGLITPNYTRQHGNMSYLIPYPNSPISTPVLQGFPETGTVLRGRNEMRISPTGIGGVFSGWQGQRGLDNSNDPKFVNFLDELKSGRGRRFELSDISGHIVEFSADQHGSRFIQQKLENCTAKEKGEVFEEVLPCTSKLMTDVFGNYVIQKFFEYGSPEQRKELANQLKGQILPLSLQMYGCRVIQKALEVIELEQKTQLVRELDGHVLRCVRDQNGNHVIQKCIESIPTQNIDFIISAFQNHVATLSMHPYGCRVIQRVLERCTDELQCQFIVNEILDSACTLAQDQYGNYVTQHVLERGKSHERSQIIRKLSGHIIQLSQHKFASNVIEKCMEYSDASDRDLLIAEIIGPDEANDNLLTMMKDQFANYVVQKMLDVCSENQRMMLLFRIKVQAHALKKYTYGKHIVARLEELGEENQTSG